MSTIQRTGTEMEAGTLRIIIFINFYDLLNLQNMYT